MTLLKIAQIGHPVLRQPAEPVADPTDPAIAALADDMIATMLDAPGVGLAAPQVYRPLRLIVFYVPAERSGAQEAAGPAEPVVLVNPEIEPLGTEQEEGIEGCLSIPGLRGRVPRWRRIAWRAQDLSGRAVTGQAEGFHARVIQHEVDHLDGVLFLDRLRDPAALAAEGEVHHILPQPADAATPEDSDERD